MTPEPRERHTTVDRAAEFRLNFLRGLKSSHPLYNTPEARKARGGETENSQ